MRKIGLVLSICYDISIHLRIDFFPTLTPQSMGGFVNPPEILSHTNFGIQLLEGSSHHWLPPFSLASTITLKVTLFIPPAVNKMMTFWSIWGPATGSILQYSFGPWGNEAFLLLRWHSVKQVVVILKTERKITSMSKEGLKKKKRLVRKKCFFTCCICSHLWVC